MKQLSSKSLYLKKNSPRNFSEKNDCFCNTRSKQFCISSQENKCMFLQIIRNNVAENISKHLHSTLMTMIKNLFLHIMKSSMLLSFFYNLSKNQKINKNCPYVCISCFSIFQNTTSTIYLTYNSPQM